MAETSNRASFAVGFCGGSGICYGLRLVEVLLRSGARVHLSATGAALRVLEHEQGTRLSPSEPDLASLFEASLRAGLHVHGNDAVESTPASGSAGIRATVLCPCSMGTLARVAHGFSSNLIERSADVAMKEGRRLILVPRETPLSALHLRNMLMLAENGAVILPAMPGFYHAPREIADLVDFVVAKILDCLGIEGDLIRRWQSPGPGAASPFDEGEV